MNSLAIILSLALCSTACRSLYDLKNYVKTPAAGAVSDEEWKYAYAYTDAEAKRPDGIEYIIVLKTQRLKNACPDEKDIASDPREVIIGIDGKVGEMAIGGRTGQFETSEDAFTYTKQRRTGSVAFLDPQQPEDKQYQFATTGKIRISKLTKDVIEGAVVAKASPEYFVNGRFKAKVCKWGQLN